MIRFNRWSAGVSPAGARATCPRFHRLHLQFRAAFFPVTLRLAECGSETLPPRRARRPRYVRCGLRFSLSSRAPASGPSACVERPSFPILAAMKRNRFPAGWDQARVQSVLEHYEQQSLAFVHLISRSLGHPIPSKALLEMPQNALREKGRILR